MFVGNWFVLLQCKTINCMYAYHISVGYIHDLQGLCQQTEHACGPHLVRGEVPLGVDLVEGHQGQDYHLPSENYILILHCTIL